MTDRRRELEIVQDVAALIRRRPEMFFGGEANGEACLEMLRERAHWLGVGELAAEQVGPWIVVRSSRDWFSPGVSEQ